MKIIRKLLSFLPFNLFSGHRAHTVYVGLHVPARRSHRRRKHLPKEIGEKGSQDSQERPGGLKLIFKKNLKGRTFLHIKGYS